MALPLAGIVAFGEVRRAAADGHTLFLADTATMAVNPLLHASLPYDPVRDFAPIGQLVFMFHMKIGQGLKVAGPLHPTL